MNDTSRSQATRITLLFLLCLLAVPTLTEAQNACAEATWIEPGETVRGLGRAAGKPDCYRLATPGAGLLMLDVAVPAGASAEPLLTLTESRCGFGKSRKLGSLAATPSRRLVAVDARDYLICVGAQDPLLRLDDFRLATAFLPVDMDKEEPIEVEPDEYKEEPIEVEPDEYKEEPIEVEPDEYKEEPIEVEPDEYGTGVPPALCAEAVRDEHSDFFPCATRLELGRAAAGEITNPWGDDRDVFSFQLSAPETVRIWLSGALEVAAGLYDVRGQQLASAGRAEIGSGSALRRVKTLGPGLYFVRIQGERGAEGAYRLEVETLPRSW